MTVLYLTRKLHFLSGIHTVLYTTYNLKKLLALTELTLQPLIALYLHSNLSDTIKELFL